MRRFDNLLFDVDGTLIDPRLGLAASMRYAFERVGVPYDPEFDRDFCIGPPLSETLRALLPDEALVPETLAHYREHFGSIGHALCSVYPDIPETLSELQQTHQLFIATARSQRFSDLLMDHFDLSRHFTKMYGTGMNGEFYDKADLVQHIIKEHALDPARTAIVGDRRYDVLAGKASGIYTVGVTYGYGTRQELDAAGADLIVHTAKEIVSALL